MNEELTKYIDQMAAKLGVAASHVYGVVVKQTFIGGIVWALVYALIISAILLAFWKLGKLTFNRWEDVEDRSLEVLVSIAWLFGGGAAVVLLIMSVISMPDTIMSIFNPEYYAIKTILEAVK